MASASYVRGLAKKRKGDSAGGSEDIKSALELDLDLDEAMAFFEQGEAPGVAAPASVLVLGAATAIWRWRQGTMIGHR